jgi:bifunctional DNA-binding transcriptional regulator/antitoxin component of YhaV-PrlF toxin-antitoxin module
MTTKQMNSKGMILIPKSIRTLAGINSMQKISFEFRKGEIVLKPVSSVVNQLFGSLSNHTNNYAKRKTQERKNEIKRISKRK